MKIDPETFWALVRRDVGRAEWDRIEHQFYLGHANEYLATMLGDERAPAWLALHAGDLSLRAYLYQKRTGELLRKALGGSVVKLKMPTDGPTWFWVRSVELSPK